MSAIKDLVLGCWALSWGIVNYYSTRSRETWLGTPSLASLSCFSSHPQADEN